MKKIVAVGTFTVVAFASLCAVAGAVDGVWLKGTTDKDPLSYKAGEEAVFTVEPVDVDGVVPEGQYMYKWERSDDYGNFQNGTVPFDGKPFVYRTTLDKPGFVRLYVNIIGPDGQVVRRRFNGDATTPEGRAAMNKFERPGKFIFFDGGAGFDVDSLAAPEEPADFDEFWKKQFARLDKVPIKCDRVAMETKNSNVRMWAVRIDCAGLRPVTGYLTIPIAVDEGKTFPCILETHGYNADSCTHSLPAWVPNDMIFLSINAHGLKLKEFGATDADTKALRWEIRSHDNTYAFDKAQNKDPEVAYFNGMVLRVKRALQYLKTVEGWNGKDLYASGGSQGGLQTIWAAACGEGVTFARSSITWCCDMRMNDPRREKKAATGNWYIPWVEGLGYYDAVTWAKRIPSTCRVEIPRAGLGDYTCPPMGLAKLYNAITAPKKIVWVQGSEHGYVPPEYEGRDFTRSTMDDGR